MADASKSAPKVSVAPSARVFGLFDVVALIVGIVVGTAIFKTPSLIFQNVEAPGQGLALWVLGGFLSLCGALCYAELATSLPRNGGDYEYLGRAYSPALGFLFGWAQWTAVLSGSIAAMAYAFGDYAVRVFGMHESSSLSWAVAGVATVTILNLSGARTGTCAQNLLSIAKILGLSWQSQFLIAGLLMIPTVLLARFITIGMAVGMLRRFRTFSPKVVRILTWGGLRGGISVALALSIPANLQEGMGLGSVSVRDLILVMTYVVIVFSIVVQGLTIGPYIRRSLSLSSRPSGPKGLQ